MENTHENEQQQVPEQENYIPRPAWQVWGARICLVLFILIVIYQIMSIARGGL